MPPPRECIMEAHLGEIEQQSVHLNEEAARHVPCKELQLDSIAKQLHVAPQ